MAIDDTNTSGRRLATVKDAHKWRGYEWLTERCARHLIHNAQDRESSRGDVVPGNGLASAGVILRVGRKVLLDLDRLDAWLDEHRQAGGEV